jgi:hypothetical protein
MKLLHKPVAIAQHVVGGVARGGLHGAVAVARKILPGDGGTRTGHASPTVSTEPVRQPPSPSTTVKKATTRTLPPKKTPTRTPAKKAPGKKSTAKKAASKKPAAKLDEGSAPVEDHPIVHSTGPDVTTNVPKDGLEDLRP